MSRTHILVIGGGYAGMYTAMRLQSRLHPGEAVVTVVDPRSYMTYQPLLPEAAAGSLEPRHVVVPLRSVLDRCQVLTGEVTGIDCRRRGVRVAVADGHVEELGYDVLVVTPGSVSKTLPVPGLEEQAVGFTNLGEAIYLRNHVLSQLDRAASSIEPQLRRKLLTFVFVGGGYAGVEALGELEEMARFAIRSHHHTIDESEMRWVLVEAADRIMPEVSSKLADYTTRALRDRGMDVFLDTTVKTMEGGHIELADGTEFDAGTVVWTTGVAPHPVLADSDLPLDEKGRVRCRATLEVEDRPNVFAAGDCAAVPDLSRKDPDALCPPSAQHAVRQARKLADNVVARLRRSPLRDYKHRYVGSAASLGLHQGVAEIYRVRMRGWPAWAVHRGYHLARMPLLNRKFRIMSDWLLAMPFPREVVALGELHKPRSEFVREAERTSAA